MRPRASSRKSGNNFPSAAMDGPRSLGWPAQPASGRVGAGRGLLAVQSAGHSSDHARCGRTPRPGPADLTLLGRLWSWARGPASETVAFTRASDHEGPSGGSDVRRLRAPGTWRPWEGRPAGLVPGAVTRAEQGGGRGRCRVHVQGTSRGPWELRPAWEQREEPACGSRERDAAGARGALLTGQAGSGDSHLCTHLCELGRVAIFPIMTLF